MGNLYARMFRKEVVRILIYGLDAAGKTTMLYQLKLGEVVTTIPTIGFNVETLDYKNISFNVWDVGGRGKMRPLMRHYMTNAKGIIFVIDSNDHERLGDIKEEYQSLLTQDELREVSILFVANKQDLPNAKSVPQLVEYLELGKIKHNWYIVPAVAITGDGLYEGLDWLSNNIGKQFAVNSMNKQLKKTLEDTKETVATVTPKDKIAEIFKSWFGLRSYCKW